MTKQQYYLKFDDGLVCSDGMETRWFNHCLQQCMPYVLVKVKGRKATIEWDCISLPSDLDQIRLDNYKTIKQQVIQMLKLYAHGSKAEYSISPYFITLRNIPMRSAEFIAESIYKLIGSFIPNPDHA